ncbi:MAG: hypothetical protein H8E32_01750 [Nitrospinae bacterium]|nr:hypothetical protein [Nitrospinota bacterium]
MDQEETKQDPSNEPSPQKEIEQLRETLNQISGELSTIKANVQKRKSETTTLKILFYTGLAVLLFGFIYTNQTLQRAQFNNLESNITALQSQINYNLLSLQKKLREEITDMESQINDNPQYRLQNSIKAMNDALNALQPDTEIVETLIMKVRKDSQELSNMVRRKQTNNDFSPEPVP